MRVVPLALLVHFEEYEDLFWRAMMNRSRLMVSTLFPSFNLPANSSPKTSSVSLHGSPFFLAWAITIHKAQGLTLKKTVQNIKHGDHAPGMTYVGVSRVKQLQHIMFEEAFDFSRFTRVNHVVFFIKLYLIILYKNIIFFNIIAKRI